MRKKSFVHNRQENMLVGLRNKGGSSKNKKNVFKGEGDTEGKKLEQKRIIKKQ